MTAANPASATELREEIGAEELERALRRAVALGRTPSQPIPAGDRAATELAGRRRESGGRRRITLGLSLAAAAALALVLVVSGWLDGGRGTRPEFAAAAIHVAEANPRLLLTAPGWKIVRADEFEADSGELTFSDGSHRFELHWYPARLYGSYLRDRGNVSPPERGTLLGKPTTTVDYGREEYATMLPPQGSVFVEVRARLGSKPAYDRALHSLKPVDVQTWLGAMPPSTVRPDARSEAVERMLRGIPLPPGFNAAALRNEDSISNRDSLAVKVGNAVACAWVQSWIAARATGDEAAIQRAVEALANSSDWPVVRRTRVPWFSNYPMVAKQLRAGRLDRSPSGYERTRDGRLFGYGPAWKMFLGCKGTYRREVDHLPHWH